MIFPWLWRLQRTSVGTLCAPWLLWLLWCGGIPMCDYCATLLGNNRG